MQDFEKSFLDLLTDLKEHYNCIGVKAEFGEEGISYDEAFFLKNLASSTNLDFALKVGGCEALRDMLDAKTIGADILVAPMIETPYALEKYVRTAKRAFADEDFEKIKLYINIETVTGYNNLESILNCKEAKYLEGIILGRTDMSLSLGKDRAYTESEDLFNIAENIAQTARKYDKEVIIGGNVSIESVNFFKKLFPNNIDRIETRKIIFNLETFDTATVSEGINKAILFELKWLEYKKNHYTFTDEDYKRIEILNAKYNAHAGSY